MNDAFPRCAVPGSTCRLLQLESTGARPVWAVLDAAGTRHFTGEVTLAIDPVVRVYFNGGELYYAESDEDASIADRLVALGVISAEALEAGAVLLGSVTHLGRLFDRVGDLDRDAVELAVEIMTSELVGEIADHVVDEIQIASYRHHPSGVVKWLRKPTVIITQRATIDGTVPSAHRVDVPVHEAYETPSEVGLVPTAQDEALVADYEAAMRAASQPVEVETITDVTDVVANVLDATIQQPWVIDDRTDWQVELASELTAHPASVELGVGVEPELDLDPDLDPDPDPDIEYDLASLLARVGGDIGELPDPTEEFRLGDDVRAAVLAALADMDSATTPTSAQVEAVPSILMQAALETRPEHAAPTGPWLPEHNRRSEDVAGIDASQPAAPDEPVSTGGLRRLIGGTRKP